MKFLLSWGLPALLRKSNRESQQIFRGARPRTSSHIHGFVSVSYFFPGEPESERVWENTALLSPSRHMIAMSHFGQETWTEQSQQSSSPAQRCKKAERPAEQTLPGPPKTETGGGRDRGHKGGVFLTRTQVCCWKWSLPGHKQARLVY